MIATEVLRTLARFALKCTPATGLQLFPRPALVAVGGAVGVLAAIGLAASVGLILGNATPSVPRGLYLKADPADATHVTFCLGRRHGAAEWYGHYCSPDSPAGVRILKRIAERPIGNVIVAGDMPRALDSRVLGPVRLNEIRGWWRPVIQIGTSGNGD